MNQRDAVLDAIDASDARGLSAGEIVTTTNLPRRSVEVALRTLRDENGTFFSGPGKHFRYFAQREWADAYMQPEAIVARRKEKLRRNVATRTAKRRQEAARLGKRLLPRVARTTPIQPRSREKVANSVQAHPFITEVAVIPEGLEIVRLPGFTGRSRFEPDPREAFGWGSFTDQWHQMRAGGTK